MTPEQQAAIRAAQQRAAIAAAQQRMASQPAPETNMVEQGMSGVNEGIAGMLGFPVDAVTGGINAGIQGVNKVAGTDIQPIENPIGGSESLRGLMAPTISDTAPQTTAQRFGRRIGQELGASVVPGGAALRGAQAPARVAGGVAASAVGAGLGGQASREIAPESDLLDFGASILGGGVAAGLTGPRATKPQAPDVDALRARQKQAYATVEGADTRLTDESTKQLSDAIAKRSARDAMDPILSPKAHRTSEKIQELQNPTIGEVEKMRRLTGRVAGSADETERALGQNMKKEITSYLDKLEPSGVTGSNPEGVVSALREGRALTGRIKKYEAITEALLKGERRAASTGTGGNTQNAIRQNIRGILDNRKKRAGFTPDEIEKMEEIVQGTTSTNALRGIGKLSPTTGALQQVASGGMYASAAATGNPLLAIPPTAGLLAKSGAERITGNQIKELTDLILNGAPLKAAQTPAARKRIVAALMASQAASGAGQPQ